MAIYSISHLNCKVVREGGISRLLGLSQLVRLDMEMG